MNVRVATPDDLDDVLALLDACRLPVVGVPDDLAALYVGTTDDRVVGVAGLEHYGDAALLRSVAVAPERRGRHLGSRLCDEAEVHATRLGAERLFLLTETAEAFFRRRGYAAIDRALAPASIASCRELAAVCPAAAVLMTRTLAPRRT